VKALLGRKIGMTQLFDEDGNVQRVTVIQAGPCVITQLKTAEKDGYEAVQIGFEQAKKPGKTLAGHATHNKVTSKVLREVRGAASEEEIKVGDIIDVSKFEAGEEVAITGTSKGKGFAGTVKRHNFSTGPKTHGSHNYRAPGSIGSAYPEHVFKGIKMAGRMGGNTTTVKGVKVISIEPSRNLLTVKGSVPGPRRGLVVIKGAM
jgi:large subunit ribosomal protein L3